MKITERKLNEIKPYEKNAKEHKDGQVKKIAASIKEFGFNQPIVVDKDGVIIVGHGRLLAAQRLGLEKVPVLEVDVTEEQAKAYRLADNKLNESDWDMEIVIEELKSLSLEMLNLTGFDEDLILETKEDKPDLGGIGVPKSVIGDVYQLGQHRLVCGDSTDPETYKLLLEGGVKARLIFTDPPYGVDYIPREGGTYDNAARKIIGDDKTPEQTKEFFIKVLKVFQDFSTDDANIYWWFANNLAEINHQAFREAQWHLSQTVMWLKNSMIYSPGQNFHRMYEPCLVGWKMGKPRFVNRVFSNLTELWTLDQKKFADYLDVWYNKRDNTSKYIHPTQKPVQLAERALKRSSEKGDIVLDAFGGSGSTLIACEQLGRCARLIELDPKYVDGIVGRWCKFTDDNSVIKNGKKIKWQL